MGFVRNVRGQRSLAVVLCALPLLAGTPAASAPAPRIELASNCVPGRSLRGDRRAYRRFHVLPRLWDRWQASDCYPRRVDDAGLARAAAPEGLIVDVNGRDAVVVDVDRSWIDACTPAHRKSARLDPPSGTDLLALRDRLSRSPAFRDVDVLEIGLGHAYTTNGTRLLAILIGTLERSVRLQCYEDLEPMIEQAARIFRDDREAVDGFYDFLTIERSNEAVALGVDPR